MSALVLKCPKGSFKVWPLLRSVRSCASTGAVVLGRGGGPASGADSPARVPWGGQWSKPAAPVATPTQKVRLYAGPDPRDSSADIAKTVLVGTMRARCAPCTAPAVTGSPRRVQRAGGRVSMAGISFKVHGAGWRCGVPGV